MTSTYEEAKNHSLLSFLVTVVARLGDATDGASLEGLVHLIGHSDGVETNKAMRMLSFFLKWYAEQNNGEPFSWDKPGHHVLKQLVRAEGLKDGHALLGQVSPTEISGFINLLAGAEGRMKSAGPAEDLIEKLARYLRDELTGVVSGDGGWMAGADSIQRNLELLDHASFAPASKVAMHELLSRWNEPLTSLEGEHLAAPVEPKTVAALGSFLVARGPSLLSGYQAAAPQEADFLQNLIMGFLPNGEGLNGSIFVHLKNLITDPRAGLVGGHLLWEQQIKTPSNRSRLIDLVGVMGRAGKSQWCRALQEFKSVFSGMHRFMAFLEAKIEWKDPDLAPDYGASLGMLVRLSSAENYVLSRQVSLLEHWFDGKKNVKVTTPGF